MDKLIKLGLIMVVIGFSNFVSADSKHDNKQLFNQIFSEWTNAFNNKDLAKSCELFSPKVVADYQGYPRKNHHTICHGFKKVFLEPDHRYQYSFKLHEIYRANNLAAVRITWYLKVFENDKLKSSTQDEGMDIFEKNSAGKWQIVNYIGYPIIK